jgi:hypothetical protein
MSLTTQQIKFGVMVRTSTGYSFFPLWLAGIYALAFIAGVMGRLTVGIWQIYQTVAVRVTSEVQHHAMILGLGVQVILGQVSYAE